MRKKVLRKQKVLTNLDALCAIQTALFGSDAARQFRRKVCEDIEAGVIHSANLFQPVRGGQAIIDDIIANELPGVLNLVLKHARKSD